MQIRILSYASSSMSRNSAVEPVYNKLFWQAQSIKKCPNGTMIPRIWLTDRRHFFRASARFCKTLSSACLHSRYSCHEVNQSNALQVVNSILGESGCARDERRVYAVAGSKNFGKSTFARQLVNSLLNDHAEVGYLDTDLGQPEFTVPGMKHYFCLLTLLHRKNPLYIE